ncbi:MAG: hypothetical protein JSV19_12790 [Phycisphaerales bacterium]|nr:MAG: hypothetical protein JSV19_12790 [Phycisphaerales bacterium]
MPTATDSLDRLIDLLARRGQSDSTPGDAIDKALASAPRMTEVRSLKDHPDVRQFRQDLVDGFIRVDTANRLLQLLSTIVTAMTAR